MPFKPENRNTEQVFGSGPYQCFNWNVARSWRSSRNLNRMFLRRNGPLTSILSLRSPGRTELKYFYYDYMRSPYSNGAWRSYILDRIYSSSISSRLLRRPISDPYSSGPLSTDFDRYVIATVIGADSWLNPWSSSDFTNTVEARCIAGGFRVFGNVLTPGAIENRVLASCTSVMRCLDTVARRQRVDRGLVETRPLQTLRHRPGTRWVSIGRGPSRSKRSRDHPIVSPFSVVRPSPTRRESTPAPRSLAVRGSHVPFPHRVSVG